MCTAKSTAIISHIDCPIFRNNRLIALCDEDEYPKRQLLKNPVIGLYKNMIPAVAKKLNRKFREKSDEGSKTEIKRRAKDNRLIPEHLPLKKESENNKIPQIQLLITDGVVS